MMQVYDLAGNQGISHRQTPVSSILVRKFGEAN